MKNNVLRIALLFISIPSLLSLNACRSAHAQGDANASEMPPNAKVIPDLDVTLFSVDHREQFPLATATERPSTPELNVTGVVNPDASRQVPVPSLTTGRVVEIDARLGDDVKKGQLLFKVRSSDIAGAFSNYLQAVKSEELAVDNERLATIQLNRARILFEQGAIPKSNLEVAENAELGAQTALANAKVVAETAKEQLELLGVDPAHPGGTVSIYAPVAGTITDQQVTNQSGVQALSAPNPFTISDLSSIWVVCDVYENDLASVHIGDAAEISLNAYPDRMFKGRVSNIGAMLDPNIRTAKVRIEVQNPGIMRLGMFVRATFRGQSTEMHTSLPASAILHIHDRDYVYMPAPQNKFRRVEVVSGDLLSNNLQDVKSGIKPGDQVVTNALVLERTIDQ